MALLTVKVPKTHRESLIDEVIKPDGIDLFLKRVMQLVTGITGLGQARQNPFHIGHKDRDTCAAKTLCQNLKSYSFACSRDPCDQPVTVGILKLQMLLLCIVRPTAANYQCFLRQCS